MENLRFYEVGIWAEENSPVKEKIKEFFVEILEEKILKEHPKFGRLYYFLGYIDKNRVKDLEKFLSTSNQVRQFIIVKKKEKVKKQQELSLEEKLNEILKT